MKNIKRIPKYNDMYFDRSESNIYDKNDDFWTAINNIASKYPDETFTIESFIRKDKNISHLLEDVRVKCDQQKIQSICDDLYLRLYYPVPMIFHKEFEGRDDILKELLGNCS